MGEGTQSVKTNFLEVIGEMSGHLATERLVALAKSNLEKASGAGGKQFQNCLSPEALRRLSIYSMPREFQLRK
jgi:hypothetical protein